MSLMHVSRVTPLFVLVAGFVLGSPGAAGQRNVAQVSPGILVRIGETPVGVYAGQDRTAYGAPGFGYGNAATAEESILRGRALVSQAQARQAVDFSQAMRNIEQARGQAIQNGVDNAQATVEIARQRLALVETQLEYAELRRSNRLDQETINRVQRSRLPQRLTAAQLDPLSGAISWPPSLQVDEYREPREQIERLFREWYANGRQIGAPAQQSIKSWVRSLRGDVGGRLRSDEIDSQMFIQSKRFLDSLAYETHRPVSHVEPLELDVASAAEEDGESIK